MCCISRRMFTKLCGKKSVSLLNGRMLFVMNIPPDVTERELMLFFNTCGTIECIIINQDAQLFEVYEPIEDSNDKDADSHGGLVKKRLAWMVVRWLALSFSALHSLSSTTQCELYLS